MGRPKKPVRARRDNRSGRFMIQYTDLPGWHMTPAQTERDALSWARRHKDRLAAEAEHPLSLEVLADAFFLEGHPWVVKQRAKNRTFGAAYLAVRQGHVDNYLIPLMGKIPVADLTPGIIEDTILKAKRADGRDLAPATKYKLIDTLRIVLDELVVRGLLGANPLQSLVPYSKRPVAPRGAIPRDKLEILFPPTHGGLIHVWRSSMWAALMCLLLDSGLRPGEARALTWADLDGVGRIIPVRSAVKAGTTSEIGSTKNMLAKAAVISERTLQELAIWKAESLHAEPGDFVFSLNGKVPVTNEGVANAFRRGLKHAGIEGENWTPYWLRHSFVTYSMDALDDSELLMLAGHTNLATNKIYRHPDNETIIARATPAAEKLDDLRKKNKSPR